MSQVSQIIVQNKAQNKPPPPELPMCVIGIQKAAAQLILVAKQLAQDEYEDFPVIQEEIVFGAQDVEHSAAQLTEATKVLSTGSADDRPGAWDSLGEAVREMAQNTALLLHIVYGAEIKKVFALSAHTEGKLRDLLKGVESQPIGLYERNPQLFVNKVQAAMEDVQKLAQGLQQKAQEEESAYAKKELEDAAQALLVHVEPFVAHANELLAKPKDAKAKEAVVKDLKEMLKNAEKVGAPKPKHALGGKTIEQFIPEIMEIATKMQDIEPLSADGQREAQRLCATLNDITKANRVTDMGPHTGMMNQIVELHKDLDEIQSLLDNPGSKPLSNADPFDLSETHAQGLLDVIKKLSPDEEGGKEALLEDAEKLRALVVEQLAPLARSAKAQDTAATQKAKALVAASKKALDDVMAGMDLSAEQTSQVKAAEKVNSVCIKLGAMAGSKAQNKQDLFSAAKNLTDLLGEMNALLGLAQAKPDDSASGALVSQMNISSALVTPSQPKPKPKPGSAKAMMKKVSGPATTYKTPAQQRNLANPDRGSVGQGFLGIGAGAEELKTLSLPAATKGAHLLPDTDPIISGVRSLGEQLAILSKSATSGDNDSLLKAGKSIHELMKTYSAELRKRANACKDPRIAHELITLSNQLKNWSVQLKILSSVKASCAGGKDSDKALIAMAQSIQNGLRGAPTTVLKGLLA